MPVTLYHNPRCSKSRQTLQLLQDRGIEPRIIEYLKTPPTIGDLEAILNMLGMEPRELMRTKEKIYQEKKLDNPELSRRELIMAMIADPILIERPIALNKSRAAVGRPPENVLEII